MKTYEQLADLLEKCTPQDLEDIDAEIADHQAKVKSLQAIREILAGCLNPDPAARPDDSEKNVLQELLNQSPRKYRDTDDRRGGDYNDRFANAPDEIGDFTAIEPEQDDGDERGWERR